MDPKHVELLVEMNRTLGRIDGKLDSVVADGQRRDAALTAHATRMDLMDDQIQTLENGNARLIGVAAGSGGILGALTAFLKEFMF